MTINTRSTGVTLPVTLLYQGLLKTARNQQKTLNNSNLLGSTKYKTPESRKNREIPGFFVSPRELSTLIACARQVRPNLVLAIEAKGSAPTFA